MQRELERMMELEISEIQIIPVKPREGLVAFASCIINNALYIGNIAVYTSPLTPGDFRLVYPVKVLRNGKEVHCVHPICKETGEAIRKAIVNKFNEIMSGTKQ